MPTSAMPHQILKAGTASLVQQGCCGMTAMRVTYAAIIVRMHPIPVMIGMKIIPPIPPVYLIYKLFRL